jgi:hypothetical protein
VWSLVRAAWAAVADSNKRRVASISAFLSAILHPNIFGNVSMHIIDGNPGPLKWVSYSLVIMLFFFRVKEAYGSYN